MGYISIQNFYASGNPSASQFNTTHQNICAVIGGSAFSGSSYTVAPGSLDTLNISSAAKFRNSQKAEPYGLFFMTSSNSCFYNTPYLPDILPFAAPGVDCSVIGVGLCDAGNQNSKISKGSFRVWIKGTYAIDVSVNDDAYGPTVFAVQPSYFPTSFTLKASDWMIIDYSKLNGWGSYGLSSGTVTYKNLNIAFLCKTIHSK